METVAVDVVVVNGVVDCVEFASDVVVVADGGVAVVDGVGFRLAMFASN